jgi:hypothetical protein
MKTIIPKCRWCRTKRTQAKLAYMFCSFKCASQQAIHNSFDCHPCPACGRWNADADTRGPESLTTQNRRCCPECEEYYNLSEVYGKCIF